MSHCVQGHLLPRNSTAHIHGLFCDGPIVSHYFWEMQIATFWRLNNRWHFKKAMHEGTLHFRCEIVMNQTHVLKLYETISRSTRHSSHATTTPSAKESHTVDLHILFRESHIFSAEPQRKLSGNISASVLEVVCYDNFTIKHVYRYTVNNAQNLIFCWSSSTSKSRLKIEIYFLQRV